MVQPLRVLVVDDEPLIRWSVAQTLLQAGHVAIEAGSAEEGIALASVQPPPEVIFLDYTLPDSGDFSPLIALRMVAPDSAIVLMSARADTREFVADALRLGARNVLAKPFEMDAVPAIATAAHRHRRD